MFSTRKSIRKAKRNNRTMKGGAGYSDNRLIPIKSGQLIRRIDDEQMFSFISDLAGIINSGPIVDIENKLKALEKRILALETPK